MSGKLTDKWHITEWNYTIRLCCACFFHLSALWCGCSDEYVHILGVFCYIFSRCFLPMLCCPRSIGVQPQHVLIFVGHVAIILFKIIVFSSAYCIYIFWRWLHSRIFTQQWQYIRHLAVFWCVRMCVREREGCVSEMNKLKCERKQPAEWKARLHSPPRQESSKEADEKKMYICTYIYSDQVFMRIRFQLRLLFVEKWEKCSGARTISSWKRRCFLVGSHTHPPIQQKPTAEKSNYTEQDS